LKGWSVAVLAALAHVACAHASRDAGQERTPGASPPPAVSTEPHQEPDLEGTVYLVKRGDTLYSIAKSHGIAVQDLMSANGLKDIRQLEVGTQLLVPEALQPPEPPPVPPQPTQTASLQPRAPPPAQQTKALFGWPVHGVLYSRYGLRQGRRHDGIDIAAPEGTTVGAAGSGSVVYTGEQSGYGSIVILRHPNGLLTLYAHVSAILVHQNDKVDVGQPIARVGRSGRTTGPHLHFEVREGMRPHNPLFYLP